jgi:hypothetical protein
MYEAGIFLLAILAYYFRGKSEEAKPLIFKYQFVFNDMLKGDWLEKRCASMEEYYDEEDELISLCTDPERNRFFRDMGITGLSIVHNGDEIFYIRMKKDGE